MEITCTPLARRAVTPSRRNARPVAAICRLAPGSAFLDASRFSRHLGPPKGQNPHRPKVESTGRRCNLFSRLQAPAFGPMTIVRFWLVLFSYAGARLRARAEGGIDTEHLSASWIGSDAGCRRAGVAKARRPERFARTAEIPAYRQQFEIECARQGLDSGSRWQATFAQTSRRLRVRRPPPICWQGVSVDSATGF